MLDNSNTDVTKRSSMTFTLIQHRAYGSTRYGSTRYGTTRYRRTRYRSTRYRSTRYRSTRYRIDRKDQQNLQQYFSLACLLSAS